jgi:hypothetical protein
MGLAPRQEWQQAEAGGRDVLPPTLGERGALWPSLPWRLRGPATVLELLRCQPFQTEGDGLFRLFRAAGLDEAPRAVLVPELDRRVRTAADTGELALRIAGFSFTWVRAGGCLDWVRSLGCQRGPEREKGNDSDPAATKHSEKAQPSQDQN